MTVRPCVARYFTMFAVPDMQIIQEGELCDSMGKRAHFGNAIVVFTSSGNVVPAPRLQHGAHSQPQQSAPQFGVSVTTLPERQPTGDSPSAESDRPHTVPQATHRSAAAMELPKDSSAGPGSSALVGRLRPILPEDVLSLLDTNVAFTPLKHSDLCAIATSFVQESVADLAGRGVVVEVSDAAAAAAAAAAHARGGGGPAVQATVRTLILGPLVEAIASSNVDKHGQGILEGAKVVVDVGTDGRVACRIIP